MPRSEMRRVCPHCSRPITLNLTRIKKIKQRCPNPECGREWPEEFIQEAVKVLKANRATVENNEKVEDVLKKLDRTGTKSKTHGNWRAQRAGRKRGLL